MSANQKSHPFSLNSCIPKYVPPRPNQIKKSYSNNDNNNNDNQFESEPTTQPILIKPQKTTHLQENNDTTENNSVTNQKYASNDKADFANKIAQNFNVIHVTKHQMTTSTTDDSISYETHDIDTQVLESDSVELGITMNDETFSDSLAKFKNFEKLEIENESLRRQIKEQAETIAQLQIKLAAIRYIVN